MTNSQVPSVPRITPERQEFLWINHNKDHRQHPTQRSRIASYLRNRDRKRWQSATTVDKVAELTPDIGFPCKKKNNHKLLASEPVLRRETSHNQAQQSRHDVKEIGPLTILRRGNSDPFDAFAISIDARANEMMTFLRRSIEVSSIEGGASRTHWHSYDWEASVSFLYDELTASAQFAHLAVGMHPKSSSMSHSDITKALSYKDRSMVLLRARITHSGTTGHGTYYAIYMLLLAEIYCGNFSAALTHASLLVSLLQSGQILENFYFVFWTFRQDYQRAILSQSRLCFDIQAWIPEYFKPFWREVVELFPSQKTAVDVSTALNISIIDEDIKAIYVDIRKVQLALSVERAIELSNNETSQYCRAFSTWILARLHHSYLDAVEALKTMQWPFHDPRITRAHVRAFFSLAAQCYTRVRANMDDIERSQLSSLNANSNLLLKLQEVLISYERIAQPPEVSKYDRIQLWVLYVGSHAEQAAELKSRGATADCGWYNVRLAAHARRMGVMVWQDLRAVLQDIQYSDDLRPHGSQWFWKTMNANTAGDMSA